MTLAIATACTVAIAFFALVTLGTLRELMVVRTEVDALLRILGEEPPPAILNDRLPASVRERLAPGVLGARGRHAILLVSEACPSCSSLLQTWKTGDWHQDPPLDLTIIAQATSPVAGVARLAREITHNVIIDPEGVLLADLNIQTTPSVLIADRQSETVVDHRSGPDARWIEQALASERNGHSVHSVAGAPA